MSTDNALDLHAELHSLRLEPKVIGDKIAFTKALPEHLIKPLVSLKEELIAILTAIDGTEAGQCSRCGEPTDNLFTVHIGKVCSACLDELLNEEGYTDE